MKTIGLHNGDLIFKDGDFEMIGERNEIAQCLEIMLSTHLGEWFLNQDFGFNYHLALEKPNDDEIQAEVARVIAQEERVESIGEITIRSDKKKRTSIIYYEVMVRDTQEIVSGEVNIHGPN